MTATKVKKSVPVCKGYIISSYRVIKSQLDFVNNLLGDVNDDTRTLFCHILVSVIINIKKIEWIPVSSTLIKKKIQKASWKALQELGLIEVTDYSHENGLSREFKVTDCIVDSFLELSKLSPEEIINSTKYNLFTGRKSEGKLTNQKYDENRNEEPVLITSALDLIAQGFFNMKAIIVHLDELTREENKAAEEYGQYSKEHKKARARLINDDHCFKAILNQSPVKISEEIWCYSPAYRIQMSGRVSHILGGLQSASRRMKAAAYMGIEDLRNYDLKASQVSGLIQQFDLAKLNTDWLENYKENPNAKKDYAAQIGISVDCWKKCLCALMFGAYVSSANDHTKGKLKDLEGTVEGEPKKKPNAIIDSLFEEAEGDIALALEYIIKFNEAVAPLKVEIDKWHNWLLNTWVIKVGYLAKDGKRYVKNTTGKNLCITDLEKNYPLWKVKAMVSAFVLQGQESCFIHNLTLASIEYNFQVISNEHDGVVTLGVIPQAAIDKAATMSGLEGAILEEKALEGMDLIAELIEREDSSGELEVEELLAYF
ncbi:hypothetical protein [Nostoc sp. UHCC 0251]|uniref:hypothetical protein n=1 Tax=Nostoc sp. UHCC 0251 TaxID=3110240 RepID=UPI002B221281|nr:hypothetical protein [Nostoc sp. UHCC 0251]MEA5625298.1 hypothetical protein [Nostoc sp. UHCC 0251]